jgi:hypothetical protein
MIRTWRALVEAAPRVFPDDAAFPYYRIDAALADDFEPFLPEVGQAIADAAARPAKRARSRS